MKQGRVPELVFDRSITKRIKNKRKEVLGSMASGNFCAFLRFNDGFDTVVSEDIISDYSLGNEANLLKRVINNVAAKGANATGVAVSIILPEDYDETALRAIVDNIENVAKAADMQILNVNTKAARAIKSPVISVNVIGSVDRSLKAHEKKAKPGDDVVVTKWIGLEGTSIIAHKDGDKLAEKFPAHMIYDAKNFDKFLSIVPEAATAIKSGVSAMYSLSEGGVFAGLWELAKSEGVGLEIDLKKIPIKQETVEISNFYDINPYELLSGGSLLFTAKDGNRAIMDLAEIGVEAVVIGKCTDSNDRVLLNEDVRRFLEPFKQDEIFKVIK